MKTEVKKLQPQIASLTESLHELQIEQAAANIRAVKRDEGLNALIKSLIDENAQNANVDLSQQIQLVNELIANEKAQYPDAGNVDVKDETNNNETPAPNEAQGGANATTGENQNGGANEQNTVAENGTGNVATGGNANVSDTETDDDVDLSDVVDNNGGNDDVVPH